MTKGKFKKAIKNEDKKVVITNIIGGEWQQGNILSGEWNQGDVE